MESIPIWSRSRNGIRWADIPARAGGRPPDFCLIGAAKCGTTSINDLLGQHPGIFMHPLKEPHFYSTDALYAKGTAWNDGFYAEASADQICGEASTSYTRFPMVPTVPERMAADNPSMKLIYCIREPVERLRSECLQYLKYSSSLLGKDFSDLTLDALLDRLEDDPQDRMAPIAASEYDRQIRHFETRFPSDRILVVFHEDFRADPDAFLGRIFDFLERPAIATQPADRNRTSRFLDGVAVDRGLAPLRSLPFYHSLKALVPAGLKSSVKRQLAERRPADYAFSDTRLRQLQAHFAPHNDRLRERTGRDLPGWS